MKQLVYAMFLILIGLGNGPLLSQEKNTELEGIRAMMLTSKAFRSASEKAKPWLVTIESFGGVSAIAGKIGGIRGQGEGNTTGIMISEDGYILTSTFNFASQPPIITVITSDGQRHVARLKGRDDTRKICLLKIDGEISGQPTPKIIDPDSLVVGQWAISVGVGYGDTNPAISMGIISATNRVAGKAIQTDANISPANYGGPLIDIKGNLLGICVPMNPQSQAVGAGVEWYDSGIGFAVPVFGLEKLIDRLKNGETIQPAFLGVQTGPNPEGEGLIVAQVVKGSAAEQGGIKEKDVLIDINGKQAKDVMELRKILSRFEAGTEIKLTLLRKTDDEVETVDLTIVLGVPPQPKEEGPQIEPPKIR